MKTNIISENALAELVGVSRAYVLQECKLGRYFVKAPDGKGYLLKESVSGYCEALRERAKRRDTSETVDARERLTTAKAEREELALAAERRELVPVETLQGLLADLHRGLEKAIRADQSGEVLKAIKRALTDWKAQAEKILSEE